VFREGVGNIVINKMDSWLLLREWCRRRCVDDPVILTDGDAVAVQVPGLPPTWGTCEESVAAEAWSLAKRIDASNMVDKPSHKTNTNLDTLRFITDVVMELPKCYHDFDLQMMMPGGLCVQWECAGGDHLRLAVYTDNTAVISKGDVAYCWTWCKPYVVHCITELIK